MECAKIWETLIGSFCGAFFAFLLGIVANNLKEKRQEKHELKSFFILVDINQAAIQAIGVLLNDGCLQNRIFEILCTVRDSDNARYQMYGVKDVGLRLALEIREHCKKSDLYDRISRQIDFQDQVYKQVSGLFELSDEELKEKIENSNGDIRNLAEKMITKSEDWDEIKTNLQKLRLF